MLDTADSRGVSTRLYAVIEIRGSDLGDVNAVAESVKATARAAGVRVHGPSALPTKKLDCGVRRYGRRLEVDADNDVLARIVKGTDVPERVEMSVVLKESKTEIRPVRERCPGASCK